MKTVAEAVSYRRSIRKYSSKKLDSKIVKNCIKEASLAPNSSNLQLWEFHHIESAEVLYKLGAACLNQSAATTAQQMLVVVVRKDLWRKRVKSNLNFIKKSFGNKSLSDNKREKGALQYYKKIIPFAYTDFLGILGFFKKILAWSIGLFRPIYRQLGSSDMRIVAHKSAGLAAQTFMLSMASNQYDTCPMEGFDSKLVKKTLKLPCKSEINMVISCGIRTNEGIYGDRFRIPFEKVYKKW